VLRDLLSSQSCARCRYVAGLSSRTARARSHYCCDHNQQRRGKRPRGTPRCARLTRCHVSSGEPRSQ
jgi:hypothetical protein